MKPKSRALGQALLDHHKAVTKTNPSGKMLPSNYTIQYGVLCAQAGLPHLVRIVGTFLGEIAKWCAAAAHPPLNSLAVNDSGVPGDGYDQVGGFTVINWPKAFDRCIHFTGYLRRCRSRTTTGLSVPAIY